MEALEYHDTMSFLIWFMIDFWGRLLEYLDKDGFQQSSETTCEVSQESV